MFCFKLLKKFFLDYQLWVSFPSNITFKTLKRLSPTNKLGRISSQVEMTTLEAETEKQLILRLQQQIAQLTDQIQTKRETTTNDKNGFLLFLEGG